MSFPSFSLKLDTGSLLKQDAYLRDSHSQAGSTSAAATLNNVGVFFIGGYTNSTSSDFLASGSLQWTQGPTLPVGMRGPCAVTISKTSILVIERNNIHEFDAAVAGPTSNNGWQDAAKWPALKTSRYSSTCAKLGNKVIILGSYSSTEVLDLEGRAIIAGGDMARARIYFSIATGSKWGKELLFGLGGNNAQSTVEEWVEESSSWKAADNLGTHRQEFNAVSVPKHLVCYG